MSSQQPQQHLDQGPFTRPTREDVRKRLELLTTSPRASLGVSIPASFSFGAGGDLLVFLDSDRPDQDFRFLACLNPVSLDRRDLLKPSQGDTEENLSLEEKLRRERQRVQAVGVTSFSWCGNRGLLVPMEGNVFLLNPRDERPVRVPIFPEQPTCPVIDPRAAPGGNRIAFVQRNDLFAVDILDEDKKTWSAPVLMSYPSVQNQPGKTNGLASFLAQEEMDRQYGYWWSPDAKFLAYERVDETNIPEYVIVHQGQTVQKEEHRYPFAGSANPVTLLCLCNVDKRFREHSIEEDLVLDLSMSEGETDVYLGRVDWYSPTQLFVQVMNRAQDRLELILFDVSDPAKPKKRVLITENSKYWINLHDLLDALKIDHHFVWGSERTGFQHLYLYKFDPTADGKPAELVRVITSGNFVVEAVVGVDETNDLIYFMGNADAPTERHLFAARLFNRSPDDSNGDGGGGDSTAIVRLTPRGSSYVTFDSQCRRFVRNYSTLCRPPKVTLEALPSPQHIRDAISKQTAVEVKKKKNGSSSAAKRLKSSNASVETEIIFYESVVLNAESDVSFLTETPDDEAVPYLPTTSLHLIAGLQEYGKLPSLVEVPPAALRFKVGDNHALFAHVYKPRDQTRFGCGPYPTIVAVYGGPHVQRVKNEWYCTVDLRAQALADLGYMVVKCDNRGSSRRGLEFESAIYRKMGSVELEDQIACLNVLAGMQLCDLNRVGITGWSYGGYMTAMALAKHPEVFRVGVSGAPVTSWDGYDSAYTERYMGTPQNNPEGYKQGSVMTHIGKMEGKLLLVHGMVDENVHFRHTARLIDALIQNQKLHDVLILPDERHGPRKPESRVYLEFRTIQYFIEHL